MDDEEREAIRGEGFDPDDPVLQMALHLVRWELELQRPSNVVPPCDRL
ncbi:hypothetical protein [Mycobacterium sp. 1245499.0]|nr:hypothetical protein [Mycobacterium sp. 1245499.0]